ncbi:unnamed protein product [Staurois parvus]|uniref:Prolactin receptor n=1 Tax=Staurois parvus TaxID=386267 RepID=A0ABN9FJB0_9NEOB|nr:unnamed protein product [Staurois parvus]
MDNQPPLTSPDGSSHGNPPERCPRPLYSWDSTQEGHTIPHHHQSGNLRDPKVKEITREDGVMEESDIPKGLKDLYQDTTVESSSYRNPPERCPPPLYSLDSTQEGPITIPHHHQMLNLRDSKVDVKEESKRI